MSATTLVALLGGYILAACLLGGLLALAGLLIIRRRQRDESGLGDEDVAAILGYPTYPVWSARNGDRRDDEEIAS